MPLYDFICERCKDALEKFVSFEDKDEQLCSACGQKLDRVWTTPPRMGHLGKEGSDTQIAAMKQSFRERFVKKDLDSIRHKFGSEFDDSIRGAAVSRIRDGEEPA